MKTTDTWKALKEPVEHDCGNCVYKFTDNNTGAIIGCRMHKCKRYSEWKWDKKTK